MTREQCAAFLNGNAADFRLVSVPPGITLIRGKASRPVRTLILEVTPGGNFKLVDTWPIEGESHVGNGWTK